MHTNYCKLIQVKPDILECPACGRRGKSRRPPEKVHWVCGVQPPKSLQPERLERPKIDPAEQAKRDVELTEASTKAAEIIDEPSFLEKVQHYATALLRWRTAGYPVRTDEEVAEIMAKCEACDFWNPRKHHCTICGCSASLKGWAVKNKAKMATEHCSHKKEKRW